MLDLRCNETLLSIVVPIYNGAETVDRALQSVLHAIDGDRLQEVEIVVVNDGSTDHTEAKIETWMSRELPWRFVYHRLQINQGPGKARCDAIGAATGDWLYMLDVDDELISDPLQIIARYPDSSCVICPYEVRAQDKTSVTRPPFVRHENFWLWMSSGNMVTNRGVLFKKSGVKEPYPSSRYLEDWEFWLVNPGIFDRSAKDETLLSRYYVVEGSHSTKLEEYALRRIEVAQSMLGRVADARVENNWKLQIEIGEKALGKRRLLNLMRMPVSWPLFVKALAYQLLSAETISKFRV